MITTAATTASNGGIPATTLDGYFTDSSTSGLGGHQPLITISHPNGKKDEYNNNENGLSNDILKLLRTVDDSSSQVSKSLQRQDSSDRSVELNIFNDEMRLRNNFENMYKKDPLIYSGGE